MKPYRLFVVFVGMACLTLSCLSEAETCEGDKIAIPDSTTLASVQALADAGDAHAQAQMGAAYSRGKGIEVDRAKSLSWLEKSAAGGSSEGQFLLAYYYAINGRSEEDLHKGVGLFQQSADLGCLSSLFYLGALTANGSGISKNIVVGIRMITKAAEGGDALAQVWLGSSLIAGKGMSKDTKAGFNWIKRAADSGDSVAKILLASLYLDGKVTPQNPEGAQTLLESVYVKHDEQASTAAYQLGLMYLEGNGVPADTIKAFRWMIIAANSNVDDSMQRLATLTEQLPKQKLSTACSVYMDAKFATNGAKEYAHVNGGETVAILTSQVSSTEVYFPDRRLLGYIPRQCLAFKLTRDTKSVK